MDPAKIALLFERVPEGADPDDPFDREVLIAEQLETSGGAEGPVRLPAAVYEAVANQISDGDPPEVWATGQRMLEAGIDRRSVMRNLVVSFMPSIRAAAVDKKPFDRAAYLSRLERLPLPEPDDVEKVLVEVVRELQPADCDTADARVAARFGYDAEEEPFSTLLEHVVDGTILSGSLEILAPDVLVEPRTICAGVVLTHRLSEVEREFGIMAVGVDLAGFVRIEAPLVEVTGDKLYPFVADDGEVAWQGLPGWLSGYSAGDVLAVRAADNRVSLEVLAKPPAPDPDLVAALRTVYEREVEEPGLPVSVEDLVLGLLAQDRAGFSTPAAPIRDLIAAAGLELRGQEVAHDEEIWANAVRGMRINRALDRLESSEATRSLEALETFDTGETDPGRLREALAALAEPVVAEFVADELFEESVIWAADPIVEWTQRLTEAARRPNEAAPAHWLMALAREHAGDVLGAEAELRRAVDAFPGWEPAVDRLAWYLADRGRAADAARLWRSIGVTAEESPELATIEPFARTGGSRLGRNDPCWCGSGRKYKQCHLDQPVVAPLEARAAWLWRKAIAFLGRGGQESLEDVFELVAARVGDTDTPDAFEVATRDGVVFDLALHEGGWFERFVTERRPLLPEDEAQLAARWQRVDRTLYDVLAARPDGNLAVRDLRTGRELLVAGPGADLSASVGRVICGRALPVGKTHVLMGGVLTVPAGREADLLDVLDEEDPQVLADYIGRLERPGLVTRENEMLVFCTAVVTAGAPTLRKVLDEHYRPDGPDAWVELHSLSDGDEVVRARLHLDAGRLTIETTSEERMDRVLATIRGAAPDVELVSDERTPVRPGLGAGHSIAPGRPTGLVGEDDAAVLESLLDDYERRWCDMEVPALGGLTPRQAVDDPTRRETLDRLLRDMDEHRARLPPGAGAMSGDRVRRLLDIDQG